MYFVDRNQISESLNHMEVLLELYRNENGWQQDIIHSLALERITNVLIESVIDVGNSMIDGFIMRDPGSYEDIIDIMEDERVITSEMAGPLKQVIELRKMIVREFTKVDVGTIIEVLNASMDELLEFPNKVRHYLENELGPVSAFLPED
ncbi:DUF86 domain-containing protein [Sporosarcina sp. E16_3]|uniref:DUF86 domain-containing protein n=1 Tax=unclassified Sporosarcina TaxID=2647733 RepID=UPI001647C509|nr:MULTISPECIES: DUF86 domain-containing protein [unclassified Sporosarcina]MBO0602187.1 DUF86 domain-containing protein [Sporosarcina sp. E16_3]